MHKPDLSKAEDKYFHSRSDGISSTTPKAHLEAKFWLWNVLGLRLPVVGWRILTPNRIINADVTRRACKSGYPAILKASVSLSRMECELPPQKPSSIRDVSVRVTVALFSFLPTAMTGLSEEPVLPTSILDTDLYKVCTTRNILGCTS